MFQLLTLHFGTAIGEQGEFDFLILQMSKEVMNFGIGLKKGGKFPDKPVAESGAISATDSQTGEVAKKVVPV